MLIALCNAFLKVLSEINKLPINTKRCENSFVSCIDNLYGTPRGLQHIHPRSLERTAQICLAP